jgi:hypothetical protein
MKTETENIKEVLEALIIWQQKEIGVNATEMLLEKLNRSENLILRQGLEAIITHTETCITGNAINMCTSYRIAKSTLEKVK